MGMPKPKPKAKPIAGLNQAKPKSTHGGARPGAGRPRKAQKFGNLRKLTDEKLEAMLRDDVPDALRELVRGVYIIQPGKTGEERIYRQPPNLGAIAEVLNRTMGKTADKVLHGGEIAVLVVEGEVDGVRRPATVE